MEKVEEYLNSTEMEKMIEETYTSDDKISVEKETENQLNTFMKNLNSENFVSKSQNETDVEFEKISFESDDEISIISIVSDLEDIDCSEFVGTHNQGEQVKDLDSN